MVIYQVCILDMSNLTVPMLVIYYTYLKSITNIIMYSLTLSNKFPQHACVAIIIARNTSSTIREAK